MEAVESLAVRAGIGQGSRVLDLGSGFGGPARYLAWRFGCRVIGVDIHPARCATARRLSRLVGLDHLVSFVTADLASADLPDGEFTACISQEGLAHVAHKNGLLRRCAEALAPEGRIVFTDWVRGEALTAEEAAELRSGFSMTALESVEGYRALLDGAGFTSIEVEDMSEQWSPMVHLNRDRLREHRDQLVGRLGQERYAEAERLYCLFADLVGKGALRGARFAACR
ncbi:MAG: cyclopropane-fatty-acyl-phospholipid synthase family protein [Candidatus Dormibacteria bacterium]